MRNYKQDIVDAISLGEEVDSETISERIDVARNCILEDLFHLAHEGRLMRRRVSRRRGGVTYLYSKPAILPWDEWPAWTLMSSWMFRA